MAYLAFTDSTGAATLNNGRTAPANRFKDWTPDAEPIHDIAIPPSTGLIQRWLYRTDYFASFEVDKLPTSMLSVAVRLKLHLLGGGSVTVETGDSSDTAYTCTLRPGTVPEIVFSDPARLRYSMRLSLKNSSAAAMTCTYTIR